MKKQTRGMIVPEKERGRVHPRSLQGTDRAGRKSTQPEASDLFRNILN